MGPQPTQSLVFRQKSCCVTIPALLQKGLCHISNDSGKRNCLLDFELRKVASLKNHSLRSQEIYKYSIAQRLVQRKDYLSSMRNAMGDNHSCCKGMENVSENLFCVRSNLGESHLRTRCLRAIDSAKYIPVSSIITGSGYPTTSPSNDPGKERAVDAIQGGRRGQPDQADIRFREMTCSTGESAASCYTSAQREFANLPPHWKTVQGVKAVLF